MQLQSWEYVATTGCLILFYPWSVVCSRAGSRFELIVYIRVFTGIPCGVTALSEPKAEDDAGTLQRLLGVCSGDLRTMIGILLAQTIRNFIGYTTRVNTIFAHSSHCYPMFCVMITY